MDKRTKIKRIGQAVLAWLILTSCKMPDFIGDLGGAIGDMFGSLGRGIGP